MSQTLQQELDEYRKTLKHVRKLFEEDGTITPGEQDQLNALSQKIDKLWAAIAVQDDIVARIIAKLKSNSDLRAELAELSRIDMRTLLDVMTKLKQAGKLEDFADRVTTGNDRVGVAIFTIRPEFDAAWSKLVAKLNDADRKAVLERTPPGVRKANFPDEKVKGKKDGEEEEEGGVVTIEPGGITYQSVEAKLTFKSKLTGELGSTEFSVKIGPDRKLKGVELDLTLIKEKLKKMGALTSMLDLEASLSLNAEAELDQEDTRVIFNGVQAAVKGEIQAKFKEIKALKLVTFKLSATAGSGGFSVTGAIEIRIPGT